MEVKMKISGDKAINYSSDKMTMNRHSEKIHEDHHPNESPKAKTPEKESNPEPIEGKGLSIDINI
tara:strand:+ start:668 stop:862 length:195 start_codon:yes stop_codon:yes gene_type:complete